MSALRDIQIIPWIFKYNTRIFFETVTIRAIAKEAKLAKTKVRATDKTVTKTLFLKLTSKSLSPNNLRQLSKFQTDGRESGLLQTSASVLKDPKTTMRLGIRIISANVPNEITRLNLYNINYLSYLLPRPLRCSQVMRTIVITIKIVCAAE